MFKSPLRMIRQISINTARLACNNISDEIRFY